MSQIRKIPNLQHDKIGKQYFQLSWILDLHGNNAIHVRTLKFFLEIHTVPERKLIIR